MSEQKKYRCAIYTRKSSEEGLEQDFNSLEAQREACEAYVRSQAHEGWWLVADRFDDGGYSGGNIDRPALAKLMDLVRDGKIDVIVIYKIDRLTRSLTDFARLAETFDKHGVSFVSVTQQFNTTTSMGRLMLNVLLSFAQFEREITGERIRDKIAASKKKGMWMGGPIPMGYDVKDRQLIVNEEHAKSIRRIFKLYLEEGTVPALLERLVRERIRTAPRISAKGTSSGSRQFTRGHIYKLLSNPIYIGRIAHKGTSHPGQHQPIVERDLWDAVQAKLSHNTQGHRVRRERAPRRSALLADRLFSQAGNRMILTHASKAERRYDYYVEQLGTSRAQVASDAGVLSDEPRETDDLAPFRGTNRATVLRLPAAEIDKTVIAAISNLLGEPAKLIEHLGELSADEARTAVDNGRSLARRIDRRGDELRSVIQRVIASRRQLSIEVDCDTLRRVLGLEPTERNEQGNPGTTIHVPLTYRRRGRQVALAIGSKATNAETRIDTTLVTAVARAFDWFERLSTGEARSIGELAQSDGFDAAYVSHVLRLAFLAPEVVQQIVAGKHGAGLTADQVIWHSDISPIWTCQASVESKPGDGPLCAKNRSCHGPVTKTADVAGSVQARLLE